MEEMRDVHHDELYPDFAKATLKLELSEACNHRCLFCIHAVRNYKVEFMDETLLYRLLNEGRILGVSKLAFQVNGEPLMCRKLHAYIKHAKDIGYSYVFINTNGGLASTERLKELIDAGVDSIKFSFNAGTRETYLKIHGKDDFEKVLESIRYAKKYREEAGKNVKLLSTFAITTYTQDEIAIYESLFKDLVDEYVTVAAHDSSGQMKKEFEQYRIDKEIEGIIFLPKKKTPCSSLFDEIYVISNGYMTACPMDFYYNLATYNMRKNSLKDAWHGEQMVELRKRHIENNVKGLLCNLCINKDVDGLKPLNPELALPIPHP